MHSFEPKQLSEETTSLDVYGKIKVDKAIDPSQPPIIAQEDVTNHPGSSLVIGEGGLKAKNLIQHGGEVDLNAKGNAPAISEVNGQKTKTFDTMLDVTDKHHILPEAKFKAANLYEKVGDFCNEGDSSHSSSALSSEENIINHGVMELNQTNATAKELAHSDNKLKLTGNSLFQGNNVQLAKNIHNSDSFVRGEDSLRFADDTVLQTNDATFISSSLEFAGKANAQAC